MTCIEAKRLAPLPVAEVTVTTGALVQPAPGLVTFTFKPVIAPTVPVTAPVVSTLAMLTVATGAVVQLPPEIDTRSVAL